MNEWVKKFDELEVNLRKSIKRSNDIIYPIMESNTATNDNFPNFYLQSFEYSNIGNPVSLQCCPNSGLCLAMSDGNNQLSLSDNCVCGMY